MAKPTDKLTNQDAAPTTIILPDPESGIEELMHIQPPPPHPAKGTEAHPKLEPLEGPTEASDTG